MFLKEVEEARAGRYGEMITKCQAEGLPVSGIWHLFAYKPEMGRMLSDLTQEIMRGPSALSIGQRELIAAVTSATNHCPFCTGSHVAVAAEILGDEAKVRAACQNPAQAPYSEAERALLQFVVKITNDAYKIQEIDHEVLKAHSWSDEAIYDTIAVCSLFNFYNRWNDANGSPEMSDHAFGRSAKRLAEKGYI